MKTTEGLCGIKATVICDSISESGVRLTTFECEYPRIVHSELLTHGMLARNSASSRAIPAAKMAEQLTARPVRFGKNVSGMQDGGEYVALINNSYTLEEWWQLAKLSAVKFSQGFAEAGYHKQVFNRLTEPFQMMKTIITATEWNNFFWLRNHEAADPTLHELARCMFEAREQSVPVALKAGEWHLPYVAWLRMDGQYYYKDACGAHVKCSLDDLIQMSCARCAAVSYRNIDYTLEKCREVHARLIGDERKHASAMEHQATPMQRYYEAYYYRDSVNIPECSSSWESGITHMDRDLNLWSGKFKSWIQYRKLIPGENYTNS